HVGWQSGDFWETLAALLFVAVLYGAIYFLNQLSVRWQLQPQRKELAKLLASLTDETGEPLDETEVANLPVARSLAAAAHAKPLEFKLAFWQIALCGEIGFVGMWFFLMLSLTLPNQDWGTNGQAPNTSPPTITAEETNRYSLVARQIVDLLNANDYVALQNLYNPGMSKAFPPQKTSAFYTRLAKQFGKIENFDGPTGKGYRGWTAFRLHCQRPDLTMSLALDAEDKIAGIYFRPAPS